MNRIIVDPFGVDEKRKVDFDFAAYLPVGATISSAAAVSSVYSGTDTTPDIVNGAAVISGSVVTQMIGGDTYKGTLGVIYEVLMTATFSDGQIIPMAAYVAYIPALLAVSAGGGGGGFGTMALQNANAVDITGGTITGLTQLETMELCFSNGTNDFTVCYTSCVPSENVNFVLPCEIGAAGSVLTDVAGDGVLTFEAPSGTRNLSAGDATYLPTSIADGTFVAIKAVHGTLGETVAFGEIVYLKSDAKWWKARANVAATSAGLLGVNGLAGVANDVVTVVLDGIIRADSLYPTLTVGGAAYLSVATAGQITQTQPATLEDEVTRVIGDAWLDSNTLYFSPEPAHQTHVAP